MKERIALIDWFGPYNLKEAIDATKLHYSDGLYAFIGRQQPREHHKLQYVGLAKKLANRINKNHHAIKNLRGDVRVWLGEVASPRVSGRKVKVTDSLLDLAEWAHAYFVNLPLNIKKKQNPPDKAIVVYNRWWKPSEDFSTPCCRPNPSWPDLIDFHFIVGDKRRSRIVWFGEKLVEKEF